MHAVPHLEVSSLIADILVIVAPSSIENKVKTKTFFYSFFYFFHFDVTKRGFVDMKVIQKTPKNTLRFEEKSCVNVCLCVNVKRVGKQQVSRRNLFSA